jgi:signal transduction histidine kinase
MPRVSPQRLKRLFDPRSLLLSLSVGTGMGLSISFQVITKKYTTVAASCNSELGRVRNLL